MEQFVTSANFNFLLNTLDLASYSTKWSLATPVTTNAEYVEHRLRAAGRFEGFEQSNYDLIDWDRNCFGEAWEDEINLWDPDQDPASLDANFDPDFITSDTQSGGHPAGFPPDFSYVAFTESDFESLMGQMVRPMDQFTSAPTPTQVLAAGRQYPRAMCVTEKVFLTCDPITREKSGCHCNEDPTFQSTIWNWPQCRNAADTHPQGCSTLPANVQRNPGGRRRRAAVNHTATNDDEATIRGRSTEPDSANY